MSSLLLTNETLCSPRPSAVKDSGDTRTPVVIRTTLNVDDIADNHIVIRVDRFGFSANNVTYQALGEHPHFRYFDFHPAPTPELEKTHGLIPVWGFGTVVVSKHPKIPVGERVYGYFAPSKYLVVPVSPSDVNKYAFYVPRPRLPEDRRPYNQIQRCGSDPMYAPGLEAENLTMLYRPLFWTSYWCEDWLHSTGCYQPSAQFNLSILISSASSKTAFCLAYLIRKRIKSGELKNVKIIGLTSKRNVTFTQKLGLYDEVYEYNTFRQGKAFQGEKERQWIYVDVAGNDKLNDQVREHFSSPSVGRIIKNVALGVTNLQPTTSANDDMKWAHNAFDPTAPALAAPHIRWPNVEHFFMPEWLNVRKHQLSIQEIFQRQIQAWSELMRDCTHWVELQPVYGANEVRDAYIRLAKEGLGPDKGLIWSLWEQESSDSINAKL
ncbi:hypothetical protein CC1G_14193 [Coprinopsis cinerea okayama7|uniref:Uncharacterized protein n=1 Tax=Coprinopsis cinerea (strain Okayama-7 / 130 / ATCC MYA-4618 / FGSC 9003) TaxID=240176 RepID=D6RLM2_COPC7|nr:hypothetical protein CC1G_14193 [Coprinopsis cinerea okayama7\|eukprot:XP_002911660.1 hypothetical protein CC1G_14193 [Coprinopsis cinerea okayama7\